MKQQYNQQVAVNGCGAGSAFITGGPGGRAGNCRWLDEHGLRVESCYYRANERLESRASWINERNE